MPWITVLHGPNLNLLGQREPAIYGATTLAEIDDELRRRAGARGYELRSFQENGEGELVTQVQKGRLSAGLIVNAAAYSHTSIALRDALSAVGLPAVEVHLSNVFGRETFRHHSLLAPVCLGVVCGFGAASYYLGLEGLLAHLDRAARPSP